MRLPAQEDEMTDAEKIQAEKRGAFTIATVAKALTVSRATVWGWCKSGYLDCFRLTDTPKSPFRIARSQVVHHWKEEIAAFCDRIEGNRKS